MEENKNGPTEVPTGTMNSQKTNEDFNQKKPDPEDPNEQKDRPEVNPPDFSDDDIKPVIGETPEDGDVIPPPPNTSEGAE